MKAVCLSLVLISTVLLQGCVHKVVTVPVKAAYTVTKGIAKGTVAVAKAITPNKDDPSKDAGNTSTKHDDHVEHK